MTVVNRTLLQPGGVLQIRGVTLRYLGEPNAGARNQPPTAAAKRLRTFKVNRVSI